MKVFKIGLLYKIILALAIAPAFGQYYGGGSSVRPHAHSGVGDGGRITNLTTLGAFKAETLIIKSSSTAARPSTTTTGTPIYYNTSINSLEVFNSSSAAWERPLMVNSSFSVSGGVESIWNNYKFHKLTTSADTLTVSGISNPNVIMLICAGGAGGVQNGDTGGGGGAGGCIQVTTATLTAGVYSVTIGTGGAVNTEGNNTIAFGYTALKGGKGGVYNSATLKCSAGGSGGGTGTAADTVCLGTTGQGNSGGVGSSGGGGGAGGASPGLATGGAALNWPAGSQNYYGRGGDSKVAVAVKLANSADGGDGWTTGTAGGSGVVIVGYPVSITGSSATASLMNFQSSATISGAVGIGTTSVSAALSIQTAVGVRTTDYYALLISSGNQTRSFGVHNNGHFSIYGATTTLATCTNGTIIANSHDTAGGVNFGGANSSCGFGFGSPFDTNPACFCTTKNAGNNGCQVSQVSVSSVTFTPITGNYSSADAVYYFCIGIH